jgi:predicted DNA-binding ribbon-helix-helix protein
MQAPAEGENFKLSLDPGLALPKKRSLTIAGHRTSITLEDAFWHELKAAAADIDVSVTALVSAIDASREPASLSASIRVFLLTRAREQTAWAPRSSPSP